MTVLKKEYNENLYNSNENLNNTSKIDLTEDGPIIFIPTNGAGLGHLTRTLAIARQIKKIDPNREIIFFSSSPAMHLVLKEGFLGYHLPSRMTYPNGISARQWGDLLKYNLSKVLEFHKPKLLVFDGTYPYQSIISSFIKIKKDIDLKSVWIKRLKYKGDTEKASIAKEKYFDFIIRPKEAGSKVSEEEKYFYSDPIVFLDKSELLEKDTVRSQWRIPKDLKIIYVQLGAGNINDINSIVSMVLSILGERKDIFVVLGESMIGESMDIGGDRLFVLRDYPNSRFYNAFDLAISAVGYNTYHELMYFQVPTIFIPNEDTKSDDQVARATYASKEGAALSIRNPTKSDIEKAIEICLDEDVNNMMKINASQLVRNNGADEIARFLLEI